MRGTAHSPLAVVRASSRRGRRLLARLEARSREVLDPATVARAEKIVAAVERRGDRALLAAVRRHDGLVVEGVADLRLPVPDPQEELERLPPGFAAALDGAIGAVERFHRPQVVPGYRLEDGGIELIERRQPLRRVGVYVPGGRASYPSTVVMTVVPARVAGVEQIAVATPAASFHGSPALRYTLGRLGIDEVWGMGGAHAVAALAYGTATIPRVDKIVGPGNAWVTAAKRRVYGVVGIDGLAGPSEVVIVAAPGSGDPGDGRLAGLLAADLLAQAEHDPRAAAVLLTPDRDLARVVAGEVAAQLATLPTAATARRSLAAFGAVLLVADLEEALGLVERLAPEHLQLVGSAAETLAERVTAAGGVFLGPASPEVFGDYVAGPSHVLPTGGSARFASALGVEDFVRRSHTVRFDAAAARRWAGPTAVLAQAEGFPAHAAAASRRAP